MDLQTRKLELIKIFLNLQNEDLICRIENLLRKETTVSVSDKTISITVEELNKRIDQSLEDSKNGKLTEVNLLLEEIEKWN